MKNPVAKHAPRFNKSKVEPDKKHRAKAGYAKHRLASNLESLYQEAVDEQSEVEAKWWIRFLYDEEDGKYWPSGDIEHGN